jgi:transcriptional regulator with XRE-family HTH domain
MDHTDVKAFGEALGLFRTRAGLTQQGLADKLGMSRRSVATWEAGDNLPKTKGVVLQIADIFGLNDEDTMLLLKTAGMDPAPRVCNIPYPRNPYFTGRGLSCCGVCSVVTMGTIFATCISLC